jgi:hypothetical protein
MKTRARGVAVVENVIEIARSPEDVFDYSVDLEREPEWTPKARRVTKVTEGPIVSEHGSRPSTRRVMR